MAVSGQDTIVLNADLCFILGVAKRTIIKVLLSRLGFTEGSYSLKDYWQTIYTYVYLFFFYYILLELYGSQREIEYI